MGSRLVTDAFNAAEVAHLMERQPLISVNKPLKETFQGVNLSFIANGIANGNKDKATKKGLISETLAG
jgi:hypothetical protein